jgi:hypothetical protein
MLASSRWQWPTAGRTLRMQGLKCVVRVSGGNEDPACLLLRVALRRHVNGWGLRLDVTLTC